MERNGSNSHCHQESYHSFLKALKGKFVKVYRGGPESKLGKLLDVKSDYVALHLVNQEQGGDQTKESPVIYYQIQHIKSISEDTKINSSQGLINDEHVADYHPAENFAGVLRQLLGENIKINQGGPESKKGRLAGLSEDFVVLYTEDDGIVYTNLHHVKSISKLPQHAEEEIEYPDFFDRGNFHDIFKHFSHQWVSINRGGPEAAEGVLVENSGGHYTLVSNEEILRILPFHIKSISEGPKGALKQNKQNSEETAEENEVEESTEELTEVSEANNSEETPKEESKSHYSSREKTIKTIDYVWKGHRR